MRASHALTAAPDYNKRKLVQAMEDAGPVFVYAHNFLQRAVEDAKKKNSAADADAATSDADSGGGSSSEGSSSELDVVEPWNVKSRCRRSRVRHR